MICSAQELDIFRSEATQTRLIMNVVMLTATMKQQNTIYVGIFTQRAKEKWQILNKDLDSIDGKQVRYVQSALKVGGILSGFTIRFTDGSLLKVDASGNAGVEVKFIPYSRMEYDGEVKGGCQFHRDAKNQHCPDCLSKKRIAT